MPSELLLRLRPVYEEGPAALVMAAQAGAPPAPSWPLGNFGNVIVPVRSIVAHLTAGWPRRDVSDTFVERFTVNGAARRGIGPQFYISQDGTVARLIDLPRRTNHAEFVNGFALGVETGNLGNVAPPPSNNWIQASINAEEVPGAKLWITSSRPVHSEVLPCWWTTATYVGPGREAVGANHMLFSEWQYRAWALLARYVMEEHHLPRNFPLLPHVLRNPMEGDSARFRRIVLADERADMMLRAFSAAPIGIAPVNFNPANAGVLQAQYSAAIAPATPALREHNRAWRAFFNVYKGLHGHGFSGAIFAGNHDHDCPGALFDFHRLAREVWDWWWYPFDVQGGTTAVPRRGYRHFDADTPLLEYYHDEDEGLRTARIVDGIHGPTSSPTTFQLDPASPVYALANGELVAARFPPPGEGVSLAFILVRHEIYHEPDLANLVRIVMGLPLASPGTINYDIAPSYAYTLYMHLGRPAGMSFEELNDDNPDWLNRVLMRKRECDLGVAFYNANPGHHGIPPNVWNNRPPGGVARPTTLEAWQIDQVELTRFLEALAAGNIAFAPLVNRSQAIRILLGDFLGESGVIRQVGGAITHGLRVEVFSRDLIPHTFAQAATNNWAPPAGLASPFSLRFQSEWARTPVGAEADALTGIGVDVGQLGWWFVVSLVTLANPDVPRAAKLPVHGEVYHYQILDFLRWLNDTTWTHEWTKYEVTDAGGNPIVPRPPRPRTRRV